MIAVGLMSGTSCDGVDVAIVETDGKNEINCIGGSTLPFGDDLRNRLLEASQHDVPTTEILRLEKKLTEHHLDAIKLLYRHHPNEAKKVEAIGLHGHTIRHVPNEGLTMQIGNPWLMASQLGVPVITDFRRCDMAVGGQGAPLVSMFHRSLFADEPHPTLVLNIGGVANVTWLGEKDEIIAGDTGPGCGLLDEWAQSMADMPHDRNGQLSMEGEVHWEFVEEALKAEFFERPLPKAADRYDFDHVDVSRLSVNDGAATLCAVTAEAVFRAVQKLPAMPKRVWVTGGGVHHPIIMQMLADRFKEIKNVNEMGLDPDRLEAECFAWLAVRHVFKLPLTLPETTGCEKPVCGGLSAQF